MIKQRDPLLAVIFSIIPGLGQLYNGQLKKALIVLLLHFALVICFFYSQLFMSGMGICILLFSGISILLYSIFDSLLVARKSKAYELKQYNIWYIYLLFSLGIISTEVLMESTATNAVRTFKIPTGSMEPTIMIGDRIITQVGYYNNHLIKNNDLIVFYYPPEFDKEISLKTHYVSRCIGIPGDVIAIKNKAVYINDKLSKNSIDTKFKYKCYTSNPLSERIKDKYNIYFHDIYLNDMINLGSKPGYLMDISNNNIERLRKSQLFDSIVDLNMSELDQSILTFPFAHKSTNWTTDNYGPLWIPKKGSTIKLDSEMLEIYGQTILHYERNSKTELVDGELFIDGNAVSQYTFKQNYYFTMGDNRHNSSDGRYWGFVPEDHIVSKAWMVLYSYDPELSFPDNFRKERFFIPIK